MTVQDLIRNLADCRFDAEIKISVRDGYDVDIDCVDSKRGRLIIVPTETLLTESDARESYECEREHVGGVMTPTPLTRHTIWRPAYDRRDPDPKKNYGIHGVNLTFILSGAAGAVQFVLHTQWQLPHVRDEGKAKWCGRYCLNEPTPADLGYHAKVPHYDGHTAMSDCEWTGGVCYYDGSALNAEPVFDLLVAEGEEAMWKRLEGYYAEVLGVES